MLWRRLIRGFRGVLRFDLLAIMFATVVIAWLAGCIRESGDWVVPASLGILIVLPLTWLAYNAMSDFFQQGETHGNKFRRRASDAVVAEPKTPETATSHSGKTKYWRRRLPPGGGL